MKFIVQYYIKGKPLDCTVFSTFEEARSFMKALAINPDCESYCLKREGGVNHE